MADRALPCLLRLNYVDGEVWTPSRFRVIRLTRDFLIDDKQPTIRAASTDSHCRDIYPEAKTEVCAFWEMGSKREAFSQFPKVAETNLLYEPKPAG
jgi:hypothetical protein